jgi:hypothetical protein
MAAPPKASGSSIVVDTPKAGSSKVKGTKRKQPDDSTDPAPSLPTSTRAEVVLPQPKIRLPRKPATIPATPSFSPAQSFADLPPPSPIGTTSSLPALSSSSQLLEIAILKSQLDAANKSLRRERERSQQELQVLREQFDRERSAYQDYIKSLESERHH